MWWHELVHVRRRDYLANLVCRVSALPIMYHPVAHLFCGACVRTREMVCDAIAAKKMASRVALCALPGGAGRYVQAWRGPQAWRVRRCLADGALEERVMELLGTKQKASAGCVCCALA